MIFSFDLVQTRSFLPVKSMIYPTRFWPGIQVSLRKQSVNSMRAGAAQKTPRGGFASPARHRAYFFPFPKSPRPGRANSSDTATMALSVAATDGIQWSTTPRPAAVTKVSRTR